MDNISDKVVFSIMLVVMITVLSMFSAKFFMRTLKITKMQTALTHETMVVSSKVRREQTGHKFKSSPRKYGDLVEEKSKPIKVMGKEYEINEYRAGINKGIVTKEGYRYD